MALSKLSLKWTLPDIPIEPVHPPSTFQMQFWKENCLQISCQVEWFVMWPWLHYRSRNDVILCHVCIIAIKSKGMEKRNSNPSFITSGFKNWKDGTVALKIISPQYLIKLLCIWLLIYLLLMLVSVKIIFRICTREKNQQTVFVEDFIKCCFLGTARTCIQG